MLSDILSAFLSKSLVQRLRSLALERLDNVILLSTEAFYTMRTGSIFFKVRTWDDHPDTTLIQTVSNYRGLQPIVSSFINGSLPV